MKRLTLKINGVWYYIENRRRELFMNVWKGKKENSNYKGQIYGTITQPVSIIKQKIKELL